QLQGARLPVQRRFLDRSALGEAPPFRSPRVGGESDLFFVARLDPNGTVLTQLTPALRGGNEPPPALPRITLAEAQARAGRPIAAGDLSRRVEHADERTEVGRLGLALNEMLGQIEAAFGERQASEHRLRRFVADASHELRTPLTSIRGYAELFRRGAADNPADL